MCQLLGMNCAAPTDFNFSFRGFCKRGGETDIHSHGWGMAIYEGQGLRTFHDSQPAAESKVAKFVADHYPIKTLNMMAHIRYATQGKVALENVHPFQRELWGINWSFCHNGEVPKYSDQKSYEEYPLLGRHSQEPGSNPRDSIFYHPVGNTDSEATFCAILNALRAEFTELPTLPLLYETLQRLCAQLVEGDEDRTILNFLLGCGQYTLFAYSWPGSRPGSKIWNGLHYVVRKSPFSRAKLVDEDYEVDFSKCTNENDRVALIATAPLTCDENWKEFERGQLLMFDGGLAFSELYDCHEVEQQGRGLFSNVIPRQKLCQQHYYDTPSKLRTMVDRVQQQQQQQQKELITTPWAKTAADLGCGFGCSGIAFRSCVEHMIGVDLSPEMIDKARQRKCYDELVVGNVECVLRQQPKHLKKCTNPNHGLLASKSFDLIFSCNTFCYLKDLRSVFDDIRQIIRADRGVFAFTVECFDQDRDVHDGGFDTNDKPYALQSCARYAHKRWYLEEIIEEFGFKTKVFEVTPLRRKHNGRDVYAALVVLAM